MSVGRVLLVVFGAILALIGLALLAGGGALLYAHQALRDGDGYFTTATERFATPSRALVSENLDVTDLPGDVGSQDWATVRIRARSTAGRAVFVGIGRRSDVQRYLAGVPYAEITDIDLDPFRATYRPRPGSRAPASPAAQPFWAAQASGPGRQAVSWGVSGGNWQVVVMNADASAGVSVDASIGARIGYLIWIVIGLLVAGLLLTGGGIAMIIAGGRSRRGPPAGEAAPAGAAALSASTGAPAEGGYPVVVEAEPDPTLGRWLWLVKWILVIPHYIVLAFLWIAFFVVTLIAFFAILFTARYPRGLFDFTVGVMRWTWRVNYYAYSALATDRYPPFTLAPVADYPCRLDVPYPERLSRGLVLIKSWLLAIPQLIVTGIFAGNWAYGTAWGDRWWGWTWTPLGGGLIGLLALFAAVALLFTGRYPQSLYDLIVGLNRWVWRVVAYVALMRDEYPPFRLGR